MRQEQIVDWLSQTPNVGIPTKNGNAFFVSRGTVVTLRDDSEVDALDWLQSEGFENGLLIAEHSVKHTPATEEFPERFFFFKTNVTTKAPF